MKIKRITAILLTLCLLLCGSVISAHAEPMSGGESLNIKLDCRSAILMEAETGKVLYEMNADESLPPASVTKVMTLLLVMEAIESGKISFADTVTASAHA